MKSTTLHRLRLSALGGLLLGLSGACTGQLFGDTEDCVGCGPNAPGPSTPDGETPPGVEGIGWTTRFPRLSHNQWENAVRDLLRLDASPGQSETFSLDPDDSAFDTYVSRVVSSNLWLDYQRAAEIVARGSARSPDLLARIRPATAPDDPSAFVSELGRRAFRRPLTQEELSTYVELFGRGSELLDDPDAYASGVELVITAFLQSPHFLYRVESSTEAEGDRIFLSDYEIATRLSFALWNTIPSDELLDAAAAGQLRTVPGVAAWTQRMLDDPRAAETLLSFHEQFFNVSGYGTIAKNQTLFPTFTLELAPVLREEARLFFREIAVIEDGGIGELLTRPVTFVNADTAPFYGLSGNFGPELQKVELDPNQRAGILTQIGFLSKYGSQAQSDPILRGVHISLDFLCSNLPPPPNNVPPLPPIDPNQTNRQRVEQLTSVKPCSSCHQNVIDPLGFAFEHYDAIGQWRDTDNGQPVDASAQYFLDDEVVSYRGAVELSSLLAESDALHACYSKNWLEYVLGRPPAREEADELAALASASRDKDSVRALLTTITTLDTFRARPQETP